MPSLELRPLTLGEILDRTFTIYRTHFTLFIGIAAVPQAVVLAFALVQTAVIGISPETSLTTVAMNLATLLVAIVAYLVAQGGAVLAISELYLGRTITIAQALRAVWDDIGPLFGVLMLNGLAVTVGLVALVIPGIYIACRLMVSIPAAVIEKRGPSEALRRSWRLTNSYVLRALGILALFLVLTYGASLLLQWPIFLAVTARHNPSMQKFWMSLGQIGGSIATILVQPIFLIASSIFYYDLRVRKEAFDLQFLMDPTSERKTGPDDSLSII